MPPRPSILLILTVGTGTAGKDSFIAQGLRTTVEKVGPRLFWLIPSSSPQSIEVADYIRDGLEHQFSAWSEESPYKTIENPDNFSQCRSAVRDVITLARQQLKQGERLVVNPTSGTKQMSAGATLAALDEDIGEIMFTVGERADGVVKTGTERLETFNASGYFRERDFEMASELFASGNYLAAQGILRRHSSLRAEADLCACLDAWERNDYARALQICSAGRHPAFANFRHHLQPLAEETRTHMIDSPRVAADIHQTARILHERGRWPDVLMHACRALEIGLRGALADAAKIKEPYRIEAFEKLQLPTHLIQRLRTASQSHKTIHLGLSLQLDILQALAHPIAAQADGKKIRHTLEIRNEMMHQVRPVTLDESDMAVESVGSVLACLAPPIPANRPTTLEMVGS